MVPSTGYDARVERWARFLLAKTDADFDQLAAEDPVMSTAKETLVQLSLDPEVRRRVRVESATLSQLDAWVERVLTAKTLDDVFTP